METNLTSANTETNVTQPVGKTNRNDSTFVSITDWLDTSSDDEGQPLEMIRISIEPKFLSLFTGSGLEAHYHYLEADETFSRGANYHCLGDDCPACKAQIERKSSILLPVVDLDDGAVKVLNIRKNIYV